MRSSFRRQFLQLATGTSLAQFFSLILMPVISRIYAPGDMGEYALYVSISSIAGVLGNFRLDLAVVLASDDEEASRLVWLGMSSAFAVALCGFAVLCVIFGFSAFSFYTAFSIGCIGSIQPLVNWHSRQKAFPILAKRNAGEKLLVLLTGLALGYMGYTHFGLIAGQTAGLLFSLTYMYYVSGLVAPRFAKKLWHETLAKFSDFPLKNFMSTVLMSFSMFLPAILFAACFTKPELGQYNLAGRVFDIPITLVGYTFSTVYYQHSQSASAGHRLTLFWKSLRILSVVFIPAFLIAGLSGPVIFRLVFGERWLEAGYLAQWLAPLTAARLFFITQSSLLLVQRKLSVDLGISLLLFTSQLTAFSIGYYKYNSLSSCVMLMSLSGAVVYLIGLATIHRVVAKG